MDRMTRQETVARIDAVAHCDSSLLIYVFVYSFMHQTVTPSSARANPRSRGTEPLLSGKLWSKRGERQ